MSKILAITSGKGGSGKTSFAVNIGYAMAEQQQKTLVLDLNFGLRGADIYMGMEDMVLFDLGDYMSGTCRLAKALVCDPENPMLYLLCAPQMSSMDGIGPMHIKTLCRQLREMFDNIIIDCPPGMGRELESSLADVDCALIVITPEYLSLRSAQRMESRLEELEIKHFYAVNMLDPELMDSKELPGLEDIAAAMHCSPAGLVPKDINIHMGNNCGRPVAGAESSYVARNFTIIASRLAGEIPDSGDVSQQTEQ